MNKYDFNEYLKPFYESDIIYNETCMFVEKDQDVPLLFPIKKIVSVTNYSLNFEYEEGKDYLITKEGNIALTPHTRIPYFKEDEYFMKSVNGDVQLKVIPSLCERKFKEDRWYYYAEAAALTNKQIAITYEHNGTYNGNKPIYQGDKLVNFFSKIKSDKQVTILFYGDSITVGCNSSGTEQGGNIEPYCPSFPMLIHKKLEQTFNRKINYVNTSVGGMNTKWGKDNYQERVNAYKPDLVFIGFGMNDGNTDPVTHTNWIKEIIEGIKKDNPNCEFVLYSTTVANTGSSWYFPIRNGYIDEYKKLDLSNVALVDMTNTHLEFLKRKRFRDMTGNNVNHPNDFLARIYAQMILGTILK